MPVTPRGGCSAARPMRGLAVLTLAVGRRWHGRNLQRGAHSPARSATGRARRTGRRSLVLRLLAGAGIPGAAAAVPGLPADGRLPSGGPDPGGSGRAHAPGAGHRRVRGVLRRAGHAGRTSAGRSGQAKTGGSGTRRGSQLFDCGKTSVPTRTSSASRCCSAAWRARSSA